MLPSRIENATIALLQFVFTQVLGEALENSNDVWVTGKNVAVFFIYIFHSSSLSDVYICHLLFSVGCVSGCHPEYRYGRHEDRTVL